MHGVLLTAGLFLALVSMASSLRLVCYYDRNAASRSSIGKLTPGSPLFDASLCTHIIFAHAVIDNQGNTLVPVDPTDTALYTELNDLKTTYPLLKTLLSVGGPGFDKQDFNAAVASKATRKKFIDSAIPLLQMYNFDGLDLDWRYPEGQAESTKFTDLCVELRAAFNAASTPLLFTASVSGVMTVIDAGYEVSNIAPELDFINVLTFDFHSTTEGVTAHHSPLGPLATNPTDTLTTQYAMSYWKTLGAPAAKLNMGIAAFGVAFKLADPNNSGAGATTAQSAQMGCYGTPAGTWSYYTTCIYLKDMNGLTTQHHFITAQSVPYAVTDGNWVGYDNYTSLDAKVAHIKANSYGGACVWALDMDDFTGDFCEDGTYPFISYLKSIL